MSREDFIKAIYMGYNCDGCCEDIEMSCRECIEKKFAEYEKQITADAIEEYEKSECQQDSALVKAYEDGETNGWNAAIDALAEKLCAYVYDRDFMCDDVIRMIAEQLKGERND